MFYGAFSALSKDSLPKIYRRTTHPKSLSTLRSWKPSRTPKNKSDSTSDFRGSQKATFGVKKVTFGVKKSLLGSLSGHLEGNPESHFLSNFYFFGVRGVLENFQDRKVYFPYKLEKCKSATHAVNRAIPRL